MAVAAAASTAAVSQSTSSSHMPQHSSSTNRQDARASQTPQNSSVRKGQSPSLRRRLPMPQVSANSGRTHESSSGLPRQQRLPSYETDDNGNVRFVVEMEKQVKEKVIGYVPSSCGLSVDNRTSVGSKSPSVSRADQSQATTSGKPTVEASKTKSHVGTLISAWNAGDKKSPVERPSLTQSADGNVRRPYSMPSPHLHRANSSSQRKSLASKVPQKHSDGQSVTSTGLAQSKSVSRSTSSSGKSHFTVDTTAQSSASKLNTAVASGSTVATVHGSGKSTARGSGEHNSTVNGSDECKSISNSVHQTVVTNVRTTAAKSRTRLTADTETRSAKQHSNTASAGAVENKLSETISVDTDMQQSSMPESSDKQLSEPVVSAAPSNPGPNTTSSSKLVQPRKSLSGIPDLKYGSVKPRTSRIPGQVTTESKRQEHLPTQSVNRRNSLSAESSGGRGMLRLMSQPSPSSSRRVSSHPTEAAARPSGTDSSRLRVPKPSGKLPASSSSKSQSHPSSTSPSIESQSSIVSDKSMTVSASTDEMNHRNRSIRVQRKLSGTVSSPLKSSSTDQLLIKYAHQPDIVTNSVCSEKTSAKLRRLETSHAQLMKQLAAASASLHLRTLGFEAMTVLVKHLTEEGCPMTVSRLSGELDSAKNELVASQAKSDILVQQRNALISEIQGLKEDHELAMNALSVTHEVALQSANEQFESKMSSRLAAAEEQWQQEMQALKESNERNLNEMKESHQKLLAEKEQEITTCLIDLEFTHKRKLSELQRKLDNLLKEHEQCKGKNERLKAEAEAVRRRAMSASQTSLAGSEMETELKCQSPTAALNLTQEVDSLKIVVELRNTEISQLKQSHTELQMQLEALSSSKETIAKLEQKLENAEAIIYMKSESEREIMEKHRALLQLYKKESKVNTRLSMDNEELMWRLNQETVPPTPQTHGSVRRTASHPTAAKSAPGTPLVTRRRVTTEKRSPRSRPLSQSDFDSLTAKDFIRDDPDDEF